MRRPLPTGGRGGGAVAPNKKIAVMNISILYLIVPTANNVIEEGAVMFNRTKIWGNVQKLEFRQ
jgi:hypothetical protein